MQGNQAPKCLAVYRDLRSLRVTDGSQSISLPFVALDSPGTLRSRTGCDYHAHFTAELRGHMWRSRARELPRAVTQRPFGITNAKPGAWGIVGPREHSRVPQSCPFPTSHPP